MFQEELFVEKLQKLAPTQQSIQTLTQWVLFHAQYYRESIGVWAKEFEKAALALRVSMLYLCNDIAQTARKVRPEFAEEFKKVLPDAIRKHVNDPQCGDADKKRVDRIIGVWKERDIFSSDFLEHLSAIVSGQADLPIVSRISEEEEQQEEMQYEQQASKPQEVQTTNPLILTLLEHDTESVTDIVASIEAEGVAKEFFDEGSDSITKKDQSRVEKALLEHYKRTQAAINRKLRIVRHMRDTILREEKSLKQSREDLKACEEYLKRARVPIPTPLKEPTNKPAPTTSPSKGVASKAAASAKAEPTEEATPTQNAMDVDEPEQKTPSKRATRASTERAPSTRSSRRRSPRKQ